jgi:hypothetical protein
MLATNKKAPNYKQMNKLYSAAKSDMNLAENNLNNSKKLVDDLRKELNIKAESIKKEEQYYSAELAKIIKIKDENLSGLNSWKVMRDKNILSGSNTTPNIKQSTLVEGIYSI